MTAILALVLKYLPVLVQAAGEIPQITTFLSEIRAVFSRQKAWTDADEAEFDAGTEALRSDPAWNITD